METMFIWIRTFDKNAWPIENFSTEWINQLGFSNSHGDLVSPIDIKLLLPPNMTSDGQQMLDFYP